MTETIKELETTIGQIRNTINEGIQNSIDHGSDLTEDDKLKDDAPLVNYIEAITKLKANITEVVFDRGGFLFHGRVKALADAAREAGLKF